MAAQHQNPGSLTDWGGRSVSNEPRNQFTFYRSYFEAIEPLPKKDRSAIILAVCEYGLYETEPKGLSPVAMACFNLIRPTLDSGRKKAANGKQGGKSSKQSASKPEANRKQTVREKEKEKEKEKEVEVEVEGEGNPEATGDDRDILKLIGGSVGQGILLLSDRQLDDLMERMGLDGFDAYGKRLVDFVYRTGANIDHYHTLLKWWREDQPGGGACVGLG